MRCCECYEKCMVVRQWEGEFIGRRCGGRRFELSTREPPFCVAQGLPAVVRQYDNDGLVV